MYVARASDHKPTGRDIHRLARIVEHMAVSVPATNRRKEEKWNEEERSRGIHGFFGSVRASVHLDGPSPVKLCADTKLTISGLVSIPCKTDLSSSILNASVPSVAHRVAFSLCVEAVATN